MSDPHLKRLGVLILLVMAILAGSLYLIARPMPPAPVPPATPVEPVATSNPSQAGSTSSTQPHIIWSPSAITVFLLPGDIKQRTVGFTSSITLQSVSIEVVPEIAPFLRVTPSLIASLSPNQQQAVQIRAVLPVDASSSVYEGTVHITSQSKTIPQTLKVIITVGLPPDPGAAGSATLAGIDSDGDGVRDDVQRYIGLSYPQSAKERAALTQAALALEDELIGSGNGVKEVGDALDCLSYTLMTSDADAVEGKKAHDVYLSLRAVVLNTPDRAKAFVHADSTLGSTVRFSTPYAQKAIRCLIDPSLFPN